MSDEQLAEKRTQKSKTDATQRENISEEQRADRLKQKRSDESERRKKASAKTLMIEEASLNFQKKCKDLPEFVCTVCHRMLWRQSVVFFKELNYNFECDVVKGVLQLRIGEKLGQIRYMCVPHVIMTLK